MINKIFITSIIIMLIGIIGCNVTKGEYFYENVKWNTTMVLISLAGFIGMITSGIWWIWL